MLIPWSLRQQLDLANRLDGIIQALATSGSGDIASNAPATHPTLIARGPKPSAPETDHTTHSLPGVSRQSSAISAATDLADHICDPGGFQTVTSRESPENALVALFHDFREIATVARLAHRQAQANSRSAGYREHADINQANDRDTAPVTDEVTWTGSYSTCRATVPISWSARPMIESDAWNMRDAVDGWQELDTWRSLWELPLQFASDEATWTELRVEWESWFGNKNPAPSGHKPVENSLYTASPSIAGWSVWAPDNDPQIVRAIHASIGCRLELIQDRVVFHNRLTRDKLSSLKRLAYGASHEINNPLANIATRAQTLLLEETKSGTTANVRRRQMLEQINAQAFRAFDMLANLMHFANPPSARLQTADLVTALKDGITSLAAHYPELPLKQVLQGLPTSKLPMRMDRDQIKSLIQALLRNAIESGGPPEKVSVSVRRHGHTDETCGHPRPRNTNPMYEVIVSDQGAGMDPESLAFAWDPFYSGREAGRGLGFGLSKAVRIVEAHQGRIHYSPRAGGGFIVRVALPANECDDSD